jgi:molybdopterin-synthase adenylyltransferase
MYFATVDTSKAADCPACQGAMPPLERREQLVWLCGRNTVNVNPPKPLELNLNEVYETLRRLFPVRVKSHLAVMFDYEGLEVSLFNGGRMLIKNVQNENAALEAYREILKKLDIKP